MADPEFTQLFVLWSMMAPRLTPLLSKDWTSASMTLVVTTTEITRVDSVYCL